MEPTTLVVIAFCVFAFGLVSHRIENTPLTAPMLFVTIGLLAGPFGLDLIHLEGATADIIIEVTLVLVLFSDASRIRFRELRRGYRLPARLLLLGLPLTIGLGAVIAWLIFPTLSWAELALLAAVLAPTDAALGQVVVSSPRVPVRIRQALNVESGLNDGIAVPIVMVLLAAAAVLTGDHATASEPSASGLGFAAAQIGLGPVAGLIVAWPAGWLVQRAAAANSINRSYLHFAGLAIAMGAFAVAELIGGNGFIAAFTAGLVIGNTTESVCESLQEFAEDEGQLLALIAFLVFGATMLPSALEALDWQVALYIGLSLTVVRMVPVALALVGSGLRAPSIVFLGWFGPRGLATILFALLVSEAEAIPNHERLVAIITLAVAASTLAHGLTAAPLAGAFGRWVERLRARDPDGPECGSVPDLPVRIRMREQRDADKSTP
ncbi:MAG: NhaP-type Na+/H+ or K+/H+ antiporter [Planctomycetota bacterium]|jgi:NhaP-type Na+/H+ or K+/H+ antiporter